MDSENTDNEGGFFDAESDTQPLETTLHYFADVSEVNPITGTVTRHKELTSITASELVERLTRLETTTRH